MCSEIIIFINSYFHEYFEIFLYNIILYYKSMSEVWNFFTKDKNNTSVKCNKCDKQFKWNIKHGTSTLKKHLLIHEITISSNVKKMISPKNTLIQPDKLNAINEKYIIFIIKNCQPFRLSEDIHFIDFVDELNEDYKLFNRKQTKAEIMNVFES